MSDDQKTRVDPDDALNQLMRALQSEGSPAATKRQRWTRILTSVMSSKADAGSHAPGADTPTWVTPEVVDGREEHAAAGPVLDHETERLARIEAPRDAAPRAVLNSYFITQDGHGELAEMLRTGRYRIDVPEEAALPIVHWLLANGESHRAYEILLAIAPFWDRLRFSPRPSDRDRRSTDMISLETAADTAARLRARRSSRQVAAMNETLTRWLPLYDRAVALFLSTVRGPVPTFARKDDGTLARQENGQPVIQGGWPCQIFTKAWNHRAEALLTEYEEQRADHQLAGKPDSPKENFSQLRSYLRMCLDDPTSLTGRDVGMIRKILASFVSRHGQPGTPGLNRIRRAQRRDADRPGPGAIAAVLAERIARHQSSGGLATIAEELGPVTDAEAARSGLPAGTELPDHLVGSAMRCLEGSLRALTEAGVITSGDALAALAPTVAATAEAGVVESPALRLLFQDAHTAFRRSRSLLPPNREGQVRLTDLPWIAVLQPWITPDDPSRNIAQETVRDLTLAAIEGFPQAAITNTLVRELRTSIQTARLPLRLTDEPAADAFSGRFAANHLLSAKQAVPFIVDTLYHRYYGLPLTTLASLDDVTLDAELGTPISPGFAELCRGLAGVEDDATPSVARNGTIIEQSQILTTHNLAHLVCGLRLTRELALTELASECFAWICRTLGDLRDAPHHRAQAIRNAAHAWRQMIFFLAVAPDSATPQFLDWAVDHLTEQPGDLAIRFAPAVDGLLIVAGGGGFDSDGTHDSGARRFVGWTTGHHWLLDGPAQGNGRGV